MNTPPVDRRQFITTTGAAALAAQLGSSPSQASLTMPDLIRQENAKEGALNWQLTRVRADGKNFRSPWIEGYCSRQSVMAGESVDIMVSASPARKFRLDIFRLGYYGGRGARKLQELGPFERVRSPPLSREIRTCMNAAGSAPRHCQFRPAGRAVFTLDA